MVNLVPIVLVAIVVISVVYITYSQIFSQPIVTTEKISDMAIQILILNSMARIILMIVLLILLVIVAVNLVFRP
ncbi:hypothetical protein Ferp_1603 [Ferroglobus placidus DSM 10642]|uniref:Uncharacterized protein n=1 Tax=Ferroglobus placidus (strain DSM 10642 / AEDII12DO) TaxID=589924 RepID=D3RZ39_FERPA|nr:hypothetical protein Ferp_1603 [Ferroglobus placidus DSM 10642]